MRLGYLCHKYPLGSNVGAPFVHELARSVVALGHEVHVLVPPCEEDRETLDVDGVAVHQRLPSLEIKDQRSVNDSFVSRPRTRMAAIMLRSVLELQRLVKRYKLDLVHAHWAIPMGLVATGSRWLHRVPVVITAHGRDLSLVALDGVTRPPTWARPFSAFALRSANRVIFTTTDYAEVGRSYGVKPERESVIPNGVDTNLFCPDVQPAAVRSQLGLSPVGLMLLFVGSLDQKKGLFVLLDAVRSLSSEGVEVHVVMAGDGPLRADLEARVLTLSLDDRVTILGNVSHKTLPGLYAACDVYVQPSLLEPFGVVVLEAAACGKPIVASDVPGMRGVVGSELGLLVPAGDANALARAIRTLAQDPARRERMGRSARRTVEEKYTWKSVAERTAACYEKLLA